MSITRSRTGRRFSVLVAGALAAGGLVALAPAAHADTTVTTATLKWGFKQSFRTYVGGQLGALPPLGAAPVGERVTVAAPATFDPATPTVATTADEAARPYVFTGDSGQVTSATNLSVPVQGQVTYNFPSHHFVVTLKNLKVAVSGTTATIFADTHYAADEAFGDSPADTIDTTQVALATVENPTVTVQSTTATVSAENPTLTAAGAAAVPLYPVGTVLDGFTLTTNQLDPVATPAVSVSQTTVNPNGSTVVTVTGSNFDPAAALGTRPPLAGLQAGAYVVFGKFNPSWKPSEGAASSTRTAATVANGGQKWAVPAASQVAVGGPGAGAVELGADGSFTAKIRISKAQIDAAAAATPTNTQYGIYTYAGSGANAPTYETFTPIAFASTGTSVATDATSYVVTRGAVKTVTATVANPAVPGTPSGTVKLVAFGGDGVETVLDTKQLTGGTAALTIPANLAVSSGALVVRYDGDGSFAAADSSPAPYAVKVDTQVAFDKPAYAATVGTPTPISVVVTKPADVAAPTGNVVVTYTPKDGQATVLDTVTLTAAMNGVASFTLPALTAGDSGVLAATYAGNGSYNAGTAADATYSVAENQASLSLDKPSYTGVVGGSIPVGVTLAGASGKPVPTGTVTLSYTPAEGTKVDLAPVDLVSGAASVALPAGAVAGQGTLTVAYSGDGTYGATSASSTYTVTKQASVLTVVGPATVGYRTAATYTVTVSRGTGKVVVSGAGAAASRDIVNGRATFVLPATLPAGARTLTFSYVGDGSTAAAASVQKRVVVAKGAAKIAVAVTKKATAKKAGRVSVAVSSVRGGVAPTGKITITFKKGKVTKKISAKVLAKGRVAFNLPKVPAGTWVLKISYAGSTQHVAVSRAVKVKVAKK